MTDLNDYKQVITLAKSLRVEQQLQTERLLQAADHINSEVERLDMTANNKQLLHIDLFGRLVSSATIPESYLHG